MTAHTKIVSRSILVAILLVHASISAYIVVPFLLEEQIEIVLARFWAILIFVLNFHSFWLLTRYLHRLTQQYQFLPPRYFRSQVWPAFFTYIFVLYIFIYYLPTSSHKAMEYLDYQKAPSFSQIQTPFFKIPAIDDYLIKPIRSITSWAPEWLRPISKPLLLSSLLIGWSLFLISFYYVRWQFEASHPQWVNQWFSRYKAWLERFENFLKRHPESDFYFYLFTYPLLIFVAIGLFVKTKTEALLYFLLSLILMLLITITRIKRDGLYSRFIAPPLYPNEPRGWYILFVMLLLSGFTYLELWLGPQLNREMTKPIIAKAILPLNIFLLISGLLAAMLYRSHQLNREKMDELVRKELLSKQVNELLRVKLLLLNSQINSHFFFNSINFLHKESLSISEDFSKAVLLLSDILRYTLRSTKYREPQQEGTSGESSTESQVIPLVEELTHIDKLIKLGKLTTDKPLYINFVVQGDYDLFMIIPLLLVTFVENALKYGELYDIDNPLDIGLIAQEYTILFTVKNKKRLIGKDDAPSTGLGLTNVRSRLMIEYPDAHELTILDEPTHYTVSLILNL